MNNFAKIATVVVACCFLTQRASAQDIGKPLPRKRTSTLSPLEAITKFKLKPDEVEPAEFVKKTRLPEDQLQYVPVGGPRAEPEKPLMTLDQLRAKEAELDATRARHDALTHRAPPTTKLRTVALEPKPKAEKKKVKCLITCVVDPRPTRE